MQLNKILRQILNEKGLSIMALSRKTGVPVQTIHNWLAGAQPKNLIQLKSVADSLDVSIDHLCFGGSSKVTPNHQDSIFQSFQEHINAGIFEVILRKVEK